MRIQLLSNFVLYPMFLNLSPFFLSLGVLGFWGFGLEVEIGDLDWKLEVEFGD